jgi:glycosyltransferase involved in cell wall biosynthesis
MPEPVDLQILLPIHNEADSIESTIREIYHELSPVLRVQFILSEDGSNDNTKEILRNLATELPILLNLSEDRRGYSRALKAGMELFESPYLLCMDSDGQIDPKDFRKFWEIRETWDVVIGWRVNRADPFVRRIFSRFFYLIYQTVFRTPVSDPSCSFVLIKKPVAKRLADEVGEMHQGYWWEFIARAHRRGYHITQLPIHHRVRASGVTRVFSWDKMPGIFTRHVAAIFRIWTQTR